MRLRQRNYQVPLVSREGGGGAGNSLLGGINSQIRDDIYVFYSEHDLLFDEKKTFKMYVYVTVSLSFYTQ